LGEGAIADVVVYKIQKDRAEMFRNPSYVFKDGKVVVKDGKVIHYTRGKTLYVKPDYDRQINKRLNEYYDQEYGVSRSLFGVSEESLSNREHFNQIACVSS
jgi:formylmethanofuran dehydrogenase subunit A